MARFFQTIAFSFTRPAARSMVAMLQNNSMQRLPLFLAEAAPNSWHASSVAEALFYTALFSVAGTLLAIVGYKLFDYCTPGNLHEEIVKNRNLAAAIIGAAVILGVCIVVAAAIMG
jgi:uncharacterized membrane protein YjfL (UPF0719 family)